ncbi:ABC transporter permease [Nocardia puris]|uniref:NitT/TauT family transport system permease protein n=1 Tax=Nocardia puris TaxID=208602 RepID=A0A366DW96_9NOCA|nr:ABC transporter permease [Nocardia puris]MBF6209891.1 ABC transporter permease [Nocardia puris]MBF6366463.1 ABC transporter permease [Nocardia puris]MBF6458198.1 ABC transporter permease [Nocardia puris]RBO94370.1 NitT/TauT family transport system permease protein [Nocardia puris]
MTATTAAPAATPVRVTPAPAAPGKAAKYAKTFANMVGLPIVLVCLWALAVRGQWQLPLGVDMRFVPSPWAVLERLWDLAVGSGAEATSGSLWRHTAASTLRVANGFLIAAALAIPLGLLMGRIKAVNSLFDSTVSLLRPVPVTAWAPLALLLIGFGDRSTIFLIVIAAFFPILLNTIAGAATVSPRLLEAAAMLGTPTWKSFFTVVLPSAMHSITAGLRVGLGLSWVVLVVGETVGIRTGLGALITQARDMSRTDIIIAGMVVIGLAGLLSDRLLTLGLRLLTRGRPTLT